MFKRFRDSLPTEWVKYVVVAILSIAIWIWAFGMYHAPKDTETIALFYAGNVQDYAFESEAKDAFDYLKSVEVSSANPDGDAYNFKQKYQVVALMASDVVIVPERIAKDTDCKVVFTELEGIDGKPFIPQDVDQAYGVYLPDHARDRLRRFFVFKDEPYVVCAVAASVNSGKETDHSMRFIEWLVK